VDFIVDDDNVPYILEVNTLPGMTETSLLPKIAGFAGLSFKDLVEEIIRLAVKD
jgi:D-alanine-D-alanine ligase